MFRKVIDFTLIVATVCSCASNKEKAGDFCQYVDPFIGTDYTGHTYPAATTPFGMVQVGPDTGTAGWQFCSGYHGSSTSITALSISRQS